MSTPGYQVTIHSALTSPLLMAGAPRTFTLLNATFCAAITLGMHSLYALPMCGIAQLIMAALTKKDPNAAEVVLRHLKKKSYYSV
jgi:type IV secretory pathway TrbD component